MAEHSDTIGMAYAMMRSERTVRASPIHKKPIISAPLCKTKNAAVPNSAL